jgi:prepilin-type N-terminal cleavage/methylation domain-containing protein
MDQKQENAFTLVEVVIALLVFAIGILAVLALFPGGLQFSQRSHSETYISEFAEMALNAVGTELELNQSFWSTNDAGFARLAGRYCIGNTCPTNGPWRTPQSIWITNADQRLEYRLDINTNIVDRALRYKLTLERSPGMMAELLGTPSIETTFRPEIITPPGVEMWVWTARYCVRTSQVVRMNEHIIKADLWVRPGQYAYEGQRHFFRYYFDYKNKDGGD